MHLTRTPQSPHGGGGFHAPPPSSRPPTKTYDRQSFVLVVDESDEVLKFMKMHLNRYFSHVVVAKTAADGITSLKQREFDVIIADCAPAKKANADFLKKVAAHWRHIPIILTDQEPYHDVTPEKFLYNVVVDIVKKPFELDAFHIAIRRALGMRNSLRELSTAMPAKAALGEAVRLLDLTRFGSQEASLVTDLRNRLTEEIVD
jgi:DNA-binding NtrC family response regulator